MAQRNRALTSAQAARFTAAALALQKGERAQAIAVARALVREVPDAADSHQLLGMCLADASLPQETEQAFRRALELAPGSEAVVLNFSAWLRQQNRLPEAAQCLAKGPDTGPIKTQQGLLALRMNNHREALRWLQRAVALQPGAVQAWHGLGNAARGIDDLETAEAAFRKALALSPKLTPVWVNLGMTLRLQGRFDEAIHCLQQAELFGHVGPELADARNGLLAETARTEEALRGARQLVLTHPQFAQGHETLARLLWEHGAHPDPSEDPFAALCAAAAGQPDHHELLQRSINLLLAAKRAEEALALIQKARQCTSSLALLDWQEAEALAALGRHDQASAHFAEAHRLLGDSHSDFLNAYARHAFRTGRIELVQSCASAAVARDASNQEAWSHLGTAWRLLGDAREHWLCDYEKLVGFVEVPPPAPLPMPPSFSPASPLRPTHCTQPATSHSTRACAAAHKPPGDCSGAATVCWPRRKWPCSKPRRAGCAPCRKTPGIPFSRAEARPRAWSALGR